LNLHLKTGFYLSLMVALSGGWTSSHSQSSSTNNIYQSGEANSSQQSYGSNQSNDPAYGNNPTAAGGLIKDLNPINSLNGMSGGDGSKIPYIPRRQYSDIYGEIPPEKGWKAMAKALDAIAPSTDTRIPPSATDLTTRYQYLLDSQRYAEALKEIEDRLAAEKLRKTPGTDVQLMFLHARALALVGKMAEAEDVYQKMTVQFPELPEPWNNLATLYVKRGQLDQARRALEMSLMINPNYGMAQANLGDINLLLAIRAYEVAAASKVEGVGAKIQIVELIANPRLSGARELRSARSVSQKNISILTAVDGFLRQNYISQRF